jgi:hypothetical protein
VSSKSARFATTVSRRARKRRERRTGPSRKRIIVLRVEIAGGCPSFGDLDDANSAVARLSTKRREANAGHLGTEPKVYFSTGGRLMPCRILTAILFFPRHRTRPKFYGFRRGPGCLSLGANVHPPVTKGLASRDDGAVTWGFYIINFVFFIASAMWNTDFGDQLTRLSGGTDHADG